MSYEQASIGGRPRPEDERYPGRRQLETLSAEDLRETGVWWFPGPDGHLSGPDDQTVMPLDASAATEDGSLEFPEGRYLLHARFALADGTVCDGHVTYAPDDGGTLRDREPTLCVGTAQLPVWHGVVEPPVADYLATLGRAHGDVFPLTWEAVFHPVGDRLPGRAPGIAVWHDGAIAYV
jgi:hypothetical protein